MVAAAIGLRRRPDGAPGFAGARSNGRDLRRAGVSGTVTGSRPRIAVASATRWTAIRYAAMRMLTSRGGVIGELSWKALTMISLSFSLTSVSLQWSRLRSWTHSK